MSLNGEIIEIKCANCGKDIYVSKDFVREKMFCTLGCLSQFDKNDRHNFL